MRCGQTIATQRDVRKRIPAQQTKGEAHFCLARGEGVGKEGELRKSALVKSPTAGLADGSGITGASEGCGASLAGLPHRCPDLSLCVLRLCSGLAWRRWLLPLVSGERLRLRESKGGDSLRQGQLCFG